MSCHSWSMTMIPVSLFVLWKNRWKVDTYPWSILYGSVVGLSGASGRLLLFWVLTKGPAYITVPTRLNLIGILIALAAILLMDFDEEHNAASPRIRTSG